MTHATCTTVSVYPNALTRGRRYAILAVDEERRQLRVRGDNGRERWFPARCFDLAGRHVPVLRRVEILDAVDDPLTPYAEANVELSDGRRRWCFFVTPDHLSQAGDLLEGTGVRVHFGAPHMIVVTRITEEIIRRTLAHVDMQGELLACTRPVEDEPEDVSAEGVGRAGRRISSWEGAR